jgi:aspartate aminotransferase-like enzyme
MLWIPGPTEVRPAIFEVLGQAMFGHRAKAMVETIERIDPGLRLAFGLKPDSSSQIGVGTHSATAMMEGSLHGVGQRVLCVINGAFSKRWAEIAETLGKEVTRLEIPWGQAADEETLGAALAAGEAFDAVTLVVNETSTGVLTPLAPIARAMQISPNTLLLVDVVSAIAGCAIDFDEHAIDFALAGINKALALPPGLCVMCASDKYVQAAKSRTRRAWYLDPIRTLEGHAARKTPTTPAIGLYLALARQMEDITNGVTLPEADRHLSGAAAWQARFDKHLRMRATTLAWGAKHGFAPFPSGDLASPTVACLRAPDLDIPVFLAGLKQAGHTIGGGYGKLKSETFRIGHMGDHTEEGLAELLTAADGLL